MFTLDLARLRSRGPQEVAGEIGPDDAVWSEVAGRPEGSIRFTLRAMLTPTGQVIARGRMEGTVLHECRRCLDEVRATLGEEIDLVWSPQDELEDPEEDGEIRRLEPGAMELDMGEALGEELLLRIPRWVLCRNDCQGLCPRCGVNRNMETCECSQEDADPRWEALRGLTFDERK
jgi:uncharacterized protein